MVEVRLDLSFGCRRGSAASSDSVTKAKTLLKTVSSPTKSRRDCEWPSWEQA